MMLSSQSQSMMAELIAEPRLGWPDWIVVLPSEASWWASLLADEGPVAWPGVPPLSAD